MYLIELTRTIQADREREIKRQRRHFAPVDEPEVEPTTSAGRPLTAEHRLTPCANFPTSTAPGR